MYQLRYPAQAYVSTLHLGAVPKMMYMLDVWFVPLHKKERK